MFVFSKKFVVQFGRSIGNGRERGSSSITENHSGFCHGRGGVRVQGRKVVFIVLNIIKYANGDLKSLTDRVTYLP